MQISKTRVRAITYIWEGGWFFLINVFAICFFHYSGCEILLIKLHGLAWIKNTSLESMLKQSFFASLTHPHGLESLFIWPRAENSLKELPCMNSWYWATCKSYIVFIIVVFGRSRRTFIKNYFKVTYFRNL